MFQYVPKHCMATPKNKNKHMHWQLLYCCSCFIRECARRRQRRACAACADCSAGCTLYTACSLSFSFSHPREGSNTLTHWESNRRERERTRAEQARWPQEVLTFDSVASPTCVSEEGKEEWVRWSECGAMRECVVELTGRRGAFNAACGI